jgi:pimeloyl-ACP methyl ester carboxylesterase
VSVDEIKPPSPLLLAAELRVFLEWPTFGARRMLVRGLPRGDGHPVIIVPGFGGSDSSTMPLRRALTGLGYSTYGWELGRNMGMRRAVSTGLSSLLQRATDDHGPASLIGWSLGGVFVRELARQHPEVTRRVFTLGSPINGDPRANNVDALFRFVNRRQPVKLDRDGFERRRVPPPVPCVAIYSKSDGIVAWQCAMESEAQHTESVEVHGSHLGYGFNPEVLRAIATRLPLD